FLSSACPYTDVQFPYWCRFIESADSERFEFLGIVDSAEDPFEVLTYLKSQECDLSEKAIRFDTELAQKLRFSISPTTLIVDGYGTVEKVWNGMWRRDEVWEAMQMVAHELPEASATQPPEQ
ncbi:MAG: hypothetical protein V3T83_15190, partial [Acidobacteriota bacterium]